jgi:hypothetical protein
VTRLRANLLRRELTAVSLKDPDVGDDIEDFAFQKQKKQARDEVQNNLARVIYRAKYNLPPNAPQFLDLTDEEIVYELILQSEYRKFTEDVHEEEETDDKKIIYRNTDEFDSIAKRLEKGEDIDLESLMTPDEDWEKVDAS